MRYRNGYPRYISVAEKKAKADAKLRQLKKKNPDIAPVILTGSKLAHTWWGKAWNANLEGYADFSNRIGRGRSYVRHGAVLDLAVTPGVIKALVQGSTSAPYRVTITINPLSRAVWDQIVDQCRGKIDSLGALLNGSLPKPLETLLTQRGQGLFPSPGEIEFNCSCPDRASMCKHVAAALYGVGARLDQDPSLFFSLRNVNKEDLVASVARSRADQLLATVASRKSGRIIENADLASAFGIDLDEPLPAVRSRPKGSRKKTKPAADISGKQPRKPRAKAIMPTERQKTPARRQPPDAVQPVNDSSPYATVVRLIRRRRVNGIGFPELKQKTGLEDTLLRNIIQRARQKKEIKNQARGLYIKA